MSAGEDGRRCPECGTTRTIALGTFCLGIALLCGSCSLWGVLFRPLWVFALFAAVFALAGAAFASAAGLGRRYRICQACRRQYEAGT